MKPMNALGAQLVLVLLLSFVLPYPSLAEAATPAADSLPALSTPRDSLLGLEAWSAWIEEQQALGALEEDEAAQLYALYERLRLAPLELNTLHEEELRQLPFLSDYQIYQLLRFRSDQGQLLSLGQLKLVPGWDAATLRLFVPIAVCRYAPPTGSLAVLEGRGQLELGYRRREGRPPRVGQLGAEDAALLSAYYQRQERLQLYVAGAKGYGEPWSWRERRGFDSYNVSLRLGREGLLRQLVLGDYRMARGLGLVLGQGNYPLGLRSHRPRLGRGLRPVQHATEQRFARGLACVLAPARGWELGFGLSQRALDATRQGSSSRLQLSEAGVHRTASEQARRGALEERMLAGWLQYSHGRGALAVQAAYLDWGDKELQLLPSVPELGARRRLVLGSLSYHWQSPQAQLRLEGELASQSGGGWALAQHLNWGQGLLGDLGLGYWRLSPSYWNSLGRGLEHAAWVHGEEGARLYWQLPELLDYTRLTLQAEAYHPLGALRRGQREGEHWSWTAELTHQLDAAGRSLLRLWWRRAQRTEGTTSRLRLQLEHSGRMMVLRCGLQLVPSALRHAWALYARVRTQLSPALHLELGADYFDAPSWQQRLYGYLPRGRHSYAPQLLYGRGYDLVLRLRARLGRRWRLEGEASYQRQFVPSRPSPMHYALSCIYRY